MFHLPELALLVAPRALHVSNGKTDGFGPEEAQRCVELVTPYFQSPKPEFTISPGGHEFSFEPAQKFFANHLAR